MKKTSWYDIRSHIEENYTNKTFGTIKKARHYLACKMNNYYTGDIMPVTVFNKQPFKIQSATICRIERTKSNRWKRTTVLWNKKERQKYKHNPITHKGI